MQLQVCEVVFWGEFFLKGEIFERSFAKEYGKKVNRIIVPPITTKTCEE
jgi:hypothetical protein